MQYLWIVMVAILYLIWLVDSILDLVSSFKSKIDIDSSTELFIVLHIVALSAYSFSLWASNH